MKLFPTLHSALAWFLNNNPARPKYLNIFEPDKNGHPMPEDFCTENPQRIFCEILNSVHGALSNNCRDARLLFNLCELGRPYGARMHPKDAAKLIHTSERNAYRLLRRVKDDLTEDLRRRHILETETR